MMRNTCDIMIKLVILILAASSNPVNGESCTAPDRGNGTCVPINFCHTLSALFTKANRTQEETDLLQKSACGFDGTTPKVCCQQSCYTPEGHLGSCIDIQECPHLASKVKRPLTEEVTNYLRSTRCYGATQYSVCCGPNPSSYDQDYCQNQAFISPPDPKTECCGIDLADDRIISGGEVARIEQYPWMALLEYEKNGNISLLCAGNLISSRYVLTVAHCLLGPIYTKFGTPKNVRLGEFDTTNDGRDCQDFNGYKDCSDGAISIPIDRTIWHPDFNRTYLWNDIALLRLKENAPFTDFIRPICLPSTDVTVNPQKYFILIEAGWGAVNETVRRSALKLQVTLPFVNHQQCQEVFNAPHRRTIISEQVQMCAGGERNMDSCKGDSGGPLMSLNRDTGRYELVGLGSFRVKPCRLNLPGVYTKVFWLKQWILDTISVWN